MKLKKQLANEEETLALGAELANAIHAGAIIFLNGVLGAGKTTFTRGFLRGLGYRDKVKSPTYTLVEPYEISNRHIFHFDLYRLQTAEELRQIGIEEYFSATAICLIEWPEKGFPVLPTADLICHLTFSDTGRLIQIEAQSRKGEEILQRLP